MSHPPESEERWQKVSASLRESLPDETSPDEKPPPGFSTRVVALAREKKPFTLTSLSRPYLAGALLLTILGTGVGAGLGISRLTSPEVEKLASLPVPSESLALEVEQSLSESLQLSADQRKTLAPDLARFNAEVIDNRRLALFHYYCLLLDLHDQIEPKLETAQQEVLRKNRQLLQREIEERFPDLSPQS